MPRRRRHALLVTVLAVLVSAVAAGATATPAGAAVRPCNVRVAVDTPKLPHAGITSVRNLSCRAARRVIRRHGRHQSHRPFGDPGSQFGLGNWSCTVFFHLEELWKARCVRGSRAFRVDYGF